jgi:hypothetical protein
MITSDTILKRLSELIRDEVPDPIGKLQNEIHEARQEEAKQKALPQPQPEVYYRYQFVGAPGVYEVRYSDLPRFCSYWKVDRAATIDVLEGRAKEVKVSDGRRLRAFPFLWVDKSENRRIQQELNQELEYDRVHFKAALAKHQQAEKQRLSGNLVTTHTVQKWNRGMTDD